MVVLYNFGPLRTLRTRLEC